MRIIPFLALALALVAPIACGKSTSRVILMSGIKWEQLNPLRGESGLRLLCTFGEQVRFIVRAYGKLSVIYQRTDKP